MKRKKNLLVHIISTLFAVMIIGCFFISSLYAELKGDVEIIKTVKTSILYCLPSLLIVMPSLAISGKNLAGKSKNKIVLKKMKRMNLMMINGFFLISLVIFLYYRANFISIDTTFFIAQIIEFFFGLSNLFLIVLNVKEGLKLSRRI